MTAGPTEEELEARQAAERLGLPFLVYRDGEGVQRIYALELGRRSVTIGRRDEADVSLPWDPECSRLHAELEERLADERVVLEREAVLDLKMHQVTKYCVAIASWVLPSSPTTRSSSPTKSPPRMRASSS